MLEDVLKEWGGLEVSAIEVYRDMFQFGEGYLQKEGEAPGNYKANPIAYWKNKDKDKGHFRIMFEDTFEDTLKELQAADFAILNGLTYFGRRNVQEHASKLFAIIFDLDGVDDKKLDAFLSGAFRVDAYPIPNYIALSGHGVHLYYLMEEPIPLFPNIKLQLKEFKYALTEKIWNDYTSNFKEKQKQGINQGFRVIGGKTKDSAKPETVRAFRMHQHPFSLTTLGKYVPLEHRVDEKKLFKESKLSLEQAKEKYPEWYEKVVVKGNKRPKKWDIAGKVHGDNPFALYDWWKRQIAEGATYHHRYFNVMCLAIYGAKCGVPEEKVREDAFSLKPFLNGIEPADPFTDDDIESALECFDLRYCTFPLRDISVISGIKIEPNKRNGLKQAQHLYLARRRKEDMKAINLPMKGPEGRPVGSGTKEELVKQYILDNPDASVSNIATALKISRTTVYKYYSKADEYKHEYEKNKQLEEALEGKSEQERLRIKRLIEYSELSSKSKIE